MLSLLAILPMTTKGTVQRFTSDHHIKTRSTESNGEAEDFPSHLSVLKQVEFVQKKEESKFCDDDLTLRVYQYLGEPMSDVLLQKIFEIFIHDSTTLLESSTSEEMTLLSQPRSITKNEAEGYILIECVNERQSSFWAQKARSYQFKKKQLEVWQPNLFTDAFIFIKGLFSVHT